MPVACEVLQESLLCPVLFSIFISYLEDATEYTLIKFAYYTSLRNQPIHLRAGLLCRETPRHAGRMGQHEPYEIGQEQIQSPRKKDRFLGTARLEAGLGKGPGHEPAACSGSKDVQQHP